MAGGGDEALERAMAGGGDEALEGASD